jgi:hypothetical protein
LDGTIVTVDYSRPQLRGRTNLFGGVVHWGEVWTPGANMATTLETNKDIELNGHRLPKGKYSVWMVVHRASPTWTLLFDRTAGRFHMDVPDTAHAVLAFPVSVTAGPQVEMLTWDFTRVTSSTMRLAMHWGTVAVPLEIKVSPSRPITFDSTAALQYLGTYPLTSTDSKNVWSPLYEGGSSASVVISYQRGSLRAAWTPSIGGGGPRYANSILIRLSDDMFLCGLLQAGEIWDVPTEITVEFQRDAGGNMTLTLLNDEREVARGSRRP